MITDRLKSRGADVIEFADISPLHHMQNEVYPRAILIGILLSPAYLYKVSNTPDYVGKMKRENLFDEDEFHLREIMTDSLADQLAGELKSMGYSAYSQSEKNVTSTGFYDEKNKCTPLPHKTIAGLAGMGWIGKNNLLVTPGYGSAISMCTVLTNAPLKTVFHAAIPSKCGDCTICKDICRVKALKGKAWKPGISRNDLINVSLCNTCLKCMVFCPWTQKYMRNGSRE